MSVREITLQWRFRPPQDDYDIRTFNAFVILGNGREPLHLYKFLTIPGPGEMITTFERWNLQVPRWEIAGEVHWINHFNGLVIFGIHKYNMREVRKLDVPNGVGRKFTAKEADYVWKIADNGNDLYCFDAEGLRVAVWSSETNTLRVIASVEPILDRIVVTCLVNLWFKTNGRW